MRREEGHQLYIVVHSLDGHAQGMTALPEGFVSASDMWETPEGEVAVIGRTANDQQRLFLFPTRTLDQETSPLFSQATRLIGIV